MVKAEDKDLWRIAEWLDEPESPGRPETSNAEIENLHLFWRAIKGGTLHLIQIGDGGKFAGFLSMQFHAKTTAWVSCLFIAVGQRRKGYGKAVVPELLKKAKSGGATAVRLLALTKAWRFWKTCGFLRTAGDNSQLLCQLDQLVPPNQACYMIRTL